MKPMHLAAFLAFWAGTASAADPVVGLWRSEPDEKGNYEYVEIRECGARICAILVRSFDHAGTEDVTGHEGKLIIWDMRAADHGRYKGGQLALPDHADGPGDVEPLSAKMRLSDDDLSVSACLIGGMICASQTWKRAQ